MEGILEIERNLMTVKETNDFTTRILRGGLNVSGRMTEKIVELFNHQSQQRAFYTGQHTRDGIRKAASLNRELEVLKAKYYPEIWEQEDDVGMYAYLDSQVVPYANQRYKRDSEKRE